MRLLDKYSNETQNALKGDPRFESLEAAFSATSHSNNNNNNNESSEWSLSDRGGMTTTSDSRNNSEQFPLKPVTATTRYSSGTVDTSTSIGGGSGGGGGGPTTTPTNSHTHAHPTTATATATATRSDTDISSSYLDGHTSTSSHLLPNVMGNVDQDRLKQFRNCYTRSSIQQTISRKHSGDFSFNTLALDNVEIVGRNSEIKILREAYENVAFRGCGPCIVSIKGGIGVGKTTLAQELKDIVSKTSLVTVGNVNNNNSSNANATTAATSPTSMAAATAAAAASETTTTNTDTRLSSSSVLSTTGSTSGGSGSGSTSTTTTSGGNGGFFCTGAYDEHLYEPYTGITEALSELATQIIHKGPQFVQEFIERVESMIGGDDIPILLDFVPEFKRVFKKYDDYNTTTTTSSSSHHRHPHHDAFNDIVEGSVATRANQLHSIFRRFIKAVCGVGASSSTSSVLPSGTSRRFSSLLAGSGGGGGSSSHRNDSSRNVNEGVEGGGGDNNNNNHNNDQQQQPTPRTPLVIVLDDLQFADPSSLLLLTSLATDLDNTSFLLVTTSRRDMTIVDEKDDPSHEALSSFFDALRIQHLQESNNITVYEILLDDLHVNEVHEIVTMALRSNKDDEKIRPLSDLLYQKTHGNPFYLLTFLRSLMDEDLLDYNLSTFSFTWDLNAIQNMSATDNVGDLAAANLSRLPSDIKMVLQVAACLSLTFERDALAFAIEGVKQSEAFVDVATWPDDLNDALVLLVQKGILTSQWSNFHFSFIHGQTKVAAFSLVPYKLRGHLKLAIGQRLMAYMRDSNKFEKYLCLATDLCNAGLKLLVKEDETVEYAKWNLLAGEFSLRKGGFTSALKYFEIGILCLGSDCWRFQDRIKLTLALHCGAAEAAYCSGEFEKNEQYSEAFFDYGGPAIPIQDCIRIHLARISVLGAQERFKEAVDIARYLLKELNMAELPPNPSMLRVVKDIVNTARLTKGQTAESLLKLPECTNRNRVLAMSVINHLSTMAYIASPNFFLVMYLKSMRWTVKYGYTVYSPVAISTYGLIVCSVLKDTKKGAEFGLAGLELARKHNLRLAKATAISALYGYVNHWSQPMRKSLLPLAYAYVIEY